MQLNLSKFLSKMEIEALCDHTLLKSINNQEIILYIHIFKEIVEQIKHSCGKLYTKISQLIQGNEYTEVVIIKVSI